MQQKILIGLILTVIIVIFIPVYWAMEPGRQEAARLRQQTEAVERGVKLYASSCTVCHGARGEGVVGPALKGTRLDAGALAKIIARGVRGTAMTAWSDEEGGPLKKHQINDLVTFIKNWDSVPTIILTPSQQTTPPVAETAAIDGSKIFADKCSGCHGKNREGISGLGLPLIPERLSALSDTKIKETILNGRSGTVMPAFKAILSPGQIDALLHFIKYTPP